MYGMNLPANRLFKTSPAARASGLARSFYTLLGNRRKHHRMPLSGGIQITCPGYAVANTHACSCVDVSTRGMAVDCPESLEAGTTVTLSADGDFTRRARIVYCLQRDAVYRVGLEFVSEGNSAS